MLNAEKIREDFPILRRKVHGKPLVYLDNAATTQKPVQVIEAISNYYKNYNSNIHRAVHTLSQEATEAYDSAHEKVAGLINAKGMREIAFTKNTTEALNIAANSIASQLDKGDEIVLTQMEHHSNMVPWQQIAKLRGAKLRYAEIDSNGELKMGQLQSLMNRKTKVVTFTHVSNALGTINPAKEIVRIAKEAGALTVMDAAQSVPHMPVNIREIGCDYAAFSAHKMLGPMGIGVLYGREEILEETRPLIYGGDMVSEVSFSDAKWNELPWKLEAGTPDVAGAVGFAAAIDYIKKAGMESIRQHEQMLTENAMKKLQNIDKLTVFGPKAEKRCGLVSFNIEGLHPHDVSAWLDAEGIAVRGGHHCAMPLAGLLGTTGSTRASFYVYNTVEETDKLADAVERIKRKFAAAAKRNG